MNVAQVASAVGKGLFAGAVGTAAMTVSSTIEMKIRGRKPSDAPAKAATKVLGVEPVGEPEKQRFSNLVHWGYGSGWGIPRALIGSTGLNSPAATAAHLGMVWGTEAVMLPSLDVAPPVNEWGAEEVAVDIFHHLVYVVGTALAFDFLNRRS